MKRQTRKKFFRKLPMLWDESMDFEVAIRPLAAAAEPDPELDDKIIIFPLPPLARNYPHNSPPPLAA